MLGNGKSTNLSVALLLSEIEDVKEITQVFKKLGVIPYFYEDLKSFWQGTLERIPALAIVDVRKMNENKLILKNHPNVMNEEMPLLFFYSERTEPLLLSTQEIFHIGTIKKAKNYDGIFKALLKRINKMILIEQENYSLKLALKAKSDQLNKLENDNEKIKLVDHYHGLTKELILKIEECREGNDFFTSLEIALDQFLEFDSFSMLELSFNGQKLISPLAHSRKYRAIPSIWVGQVNKEAIELSAQNIAAQIAIETLGHNIVTLHIKNAKNKIQKILFLKACDELCFKSFDWNLFQIYLNGLEASFDQKENNTLVSENYFSSTFKALSFIDENLASFSMANLDKLDKDDWRIVNLDLSSLTQILLKNGNQIFYWDKFRSDLIAKLEIQMRCEFKFFENGVNDFCFLVHKKNLDVFFNDLKDFSNKFYYWKYFENNDVVLFQEIKPKVYMIPTSAFAFLKAMNSRPLENSVEIISIHKNFTERVNRHEI